LEISKFFYVHISHIPPKPIYQSYVVHINLIDQYFLYVNILFYCTRCIWV